MYILNPATRNCENVKYIKSITDNSMITCDEIIGTTKSILTKIVPT